jgi:DNA-binding CsgD family transcriptional regulator
LTGWVRPRTNWSIVMFDNVLAQFEGLASAAAERAEGVAFLKAAKELYRLSEIAYCAINIPAAGPRTRYTHCYYSGTCIKQLVSSVRLSIDLAAQANLRKTADKFESRDDLHAADVTQVKGPGDTVTFSFPVRQRCTEAAVFGVAAAAISSREQQSTLLREFRILANYFHGHILRINGVDSDEELLISARELDCLKWTAAGKTAWEASVILGISERTVRFHLNMAREKLKCATTTQAVAKAVANQLIDPG